MKKYLLIAIILLGSFAMASAQDGLPVDENQKQERIQALYVAYISQQLAFTPEEAQKFWPMHTQFTNDMKAVKPGLKQLEKEEAILNIKKKYQENFNHILGTNRCERFFKMDGEFKRKLLERIRKQNNLQQRPRIRRGV
jgi:hypothetical protein